MFFHTALIRTGVTIDRGFEISFNRDDMNADADEDDDSEDDAFDGDTARSDAGSFGDFARLILLPAFPPPPIPPSPTPLLSISSPLNAAARSAGVAILAEDFAFCESESESEDSCGGSSTSLCFCAVTPFDKEAEDEVVVGRLGSM